MKRNLLLTSTFFVANLVYLFALGSWISIQSINSLMERWSQQSEMTIFLKPETSSEAIANLAKDLSLRSPLLEVEVQSSSKIKENLKHIMPKAEFDLQGEEDLIAAIPPHLIIRAKSALMGEQLFELFGSIQKEFETNNMIESSSYGKSWAEKYRLILNSLSHLTLVFLVGLGVALIFVIGNSIRSHIYSQKEQIEIMELVGATNSMIRRPFLIEGTLLSVCAMVLSLCFSSLFVGLIKQNSHEILGLLDLANTIWQLKAFEWITAILLSATVGFFGSYLCLAEINNGWSASGNFPIFGTVRSRLFQRESA